MVTINRILGLVVCLLFSSVCAHASGLRLMAEEYPPYSYQVDGEDKGVYVELVQQIQKKLDEESSKIKFYPWARGYKKLQSGDGDVLFPMCMTSERSVMFKFVGPVFWDDIYFYKKKGSRIDLKGIDDAKSVDKISVTRYDIFHLNLASLGYTNLDLSTSPTCDFMKLLNGRVDLVPMGRKVISHFFKRNPELDFNLIERVGSSVFFTTNYIAFALDTPDEVVQKWQEALDELKRNGEWQKIVDKYFPPDQIN
ncbi:ABC transporter substrate-binding protein [Desulfovibrio sp. JC022]|uniref:substrate-binding periplasmic protein n=1 Tax=Desulfovibrio sp. JC022 TaxID=2593642 RepID=UPI0013D51C8A|nr:transporter substrate-binding domain-containing protein [Desulfovibrio sp. JC022]NDV21121.1 ABC transporter substrate-binding protein [Desulfovibrio sp. JC022]